MANVVVIWITSGNSVAPEVTGMVTEVNPNIVNNGQSDVKPPVPPYVSYTTFKNLLAWLEKEGVPLRFDRSFWSKKFNGSVGPQLMNGMRFLRMLDGEKPLAPLDAIVSARSEDRKKAIRDLLQTAYTTVKFEELPRATPAMFKEWFKDYGIDGNTVRKAESFFINAAKDNDVPLSNGLKKLARNRTVGVTPPGTTQRGRKPQEIDEQSGMEQAPSNGHRAKPKPPAEERQSTKTVNLHGATVSLSVTFADLIELAAFPDELNWFQENAKNWDVHTNLCLIYCMRNEREKAIASLQKAYEARETSLSSWIKVEPQLDPIRNDPKFIAILKKFE